MAKSGGKGFLEIDREEVPKRPVKERVKDYNEVYESPTEEYGEKQAKRCMDCGTPFCNYSCPLGNLCPEWHSFVRKNDWEKALKLLHKTNNFPDFTGRLCPALCEGGCVLGIDDNAVATQNIELAISEKGWEEGWIKPRPPKVRTDKQVAVVGSGPAGLAAAQQLNRQGHNVTVYERDSKPGGMLSYGIPDFKIDKSVVARRVNQLKEEGVEFVLNTEIGTDLLATELEREYDAVVLAGGSRKARDLPVYGRELDGIHYAMDYLTQQNKRVAGKDISEDEVINAEGKRVIVIGGGDTGSDCVGTAIRQGAEKVYQIELLEKPPTERAANNPWPQYPQTLKTSSSHQEAESLVDTNDDELNVRDWSVLTKKFSGNDDGQVEKYHAARVEWVADENGEQEMKEIENSEFSLAVDLVILAIGFVHPEHEGMIEELDLELDERKNVKANDYQTSRDKFFAAGDMRRGASLIVRAINEGREVAKTVNKYLNK
ncbi:NADH/NADPH-dependent glutamate synthase small subunit [Halobacteroides halobius DSM 5150]|uniref:NADH/NADPH-dependent glutamate synthase small subunit n=1 Tax=Halobacteroides halobius (strain ATCC 35273 / DSM 5150 / MD-1) TaxID=748449 RepID=L0KBG8_HALHC|nr:glutamate synthase subunit beta [Halobacteroides halobius]AGB41433.1 NADH/NADPH-dependent glutamate synthase small subunit [Halobacteroides halobius DSM 5150]